MIDRLLVSVHDKKALVKLIGRATFKFAPALKRFSVSVISKGCRDVRFDMTDCSSLDSTFMGVLAGIAMWPVTDGNKVKVELDGLNVRTRSMLATLGLERIMICHNKDESGEQPKAVPAGGEALHEISPDVDKRESLETMITAHQDLVRVDEDNAARFCDVLTYLDQEIKRVDD